MNGLKGTVAGSSTNALLSKKQLMRLDNFKNMKGLTDAYEKLVKNLEHTAASDVSTSEIAEIRRLADNLAHSRQQGSRFENSLPLP